MFQCVRTVSFAVCLSRLLCDVAKQQIGSRVHFFAKLFILSHTLRTIFSCFFFHFVVCVHMCATFFFLRPPWIFFRWLKFSLLLLLPSLLFHVLLISMLMLIFFCVHSLRLCCLCWVSLYVHYSCYYFVPCCCLPLPFCCLRAAPMLMLSRLSRETANVWKTFYVLQIHIRSRHKFSFYQFSLFSWLVYFSGIALFPILIYSWRYFVTFFSALALPFSLSCFV